MDTAAFLVLLLSSSRLFFQGNCLDVSGQNPDSVQSCSSDIDSVREMRAALGALQDQIKQLQEKTGGLKVAFSAALYNDDGNSHFGPFDSDQIVIYRHVMSNIGSAYDRDTGIFTAPIGGVYQFHVHMLEWYEDTNCYVTLMKNGSPTYSAYARQPTGYAGASNSIILQLQGGDQMSVSLRSGTSIYDDPYYQTTFSGHLLFTM